MNAPKALAALALAGLTACTPTTPPPTGANRATPAAAATTTLPPGTETPASALARAHYARVQAQLLSQGLLRTDGGGLGIYNLTKAALIHMTRQLASELGPTRVVGIAPGLVVTDFAQVLVDNFGEQLAARMPLKRLGDPQDIANLAAFLASDLASWITGETYVIDGGAGVAAG